MAEGFVTKLFTPPVMRRSPIEWNADKGLEQYALGVLHGTVEETFGQPGGVPQ